MTPLLLAVLFVLAATARGDAEADKEEVILESLKVCSDTVKPTEDDLLEISKGDLKSENAKAVMTCWFKAAAVMRDKMFQKDEAITFLRALTPGDPKNDNVPLMKKLTDKCESLVNSQPQENLSETEAAVKIYNCMVREGRAMKLSLDEGNEPEKLKS